MKNYYKKIFTKKNITYFILGKVIKIAIILIFFNSCEKKKTIKDLTNDDIAHEAGTTFISIDESYAPIIKDQAEVFMATYPATKLNLEFKAEDKAWKDLTNDKIELIISTKRMSKKDKDYIKQTKGYYYAEDVLALDAMAIIVNKSIKDTLFTKKYVQDLFEGKTGKDKILVMDGSSATSSVRYVMDSILAGKPLPKNIKGAKNSLEVIDVVSKTPNSIGFLGISWIANPEDPEHIERLKKVTLVSVENQIEKGTFVKPTYGNLNENRYPYIRPIIYILKQNYEGVAAGFRNFMQYERGQLIFKRSYLMPIKMNFNVRPMRVIEK